MVLMVYRMEVSVDFTFYSQVKTLTATVMSYLRDLYGKCHLYCEVYELISE